MITAALIGNPNCGKTALFNALTGQQQYVGNWAGVTVEKKEGIFSANGETVRLIDLPGIYSLYPYSIEEKITKSYLDQQPPDVIINILDGTCPEKSLYLTLQLCELHLPVLIAVNMSDELEKRGVHIDYAGLAQELGVVALPVSAKKKTGLEELKRQLFLCMGKTPKTENLIRALPSVREVLRISGSFCPNNAPAFASDILSSCGDTAALPEDGRVRRELLSFISSLASVYGDSFAALAHDRYEYIGLLIKRYFNGDPSEPLTDRLDRLVLNRFWAFPLLLAVLLSVFFIVFGTPGRYLGELLSNAVNIHLAGLISAALNGMNAPVWLCRLVSQGLLGGVSAVLAFLPQLSLLYLFLTLLEDSGLMARAAFLADGPMRGIGMSGKVLHPHAHGLWLHRSRRFCRAHCLLAAGKDGHRAACPIYELLCTNAHICIICRYLLSALRRLCKCRDIYSWRCCRSNLRCNPAQNRAARGQRAVSFGAAAVPHPGYPHHVSASVAEMPQLYPAHRNAYRLSFRNNMDA